MQSLRLHKGTLVGKVSVPSSKSYANRALILASLIKPSPVLKDLPAATDVTVLLDCLTKIGLKIQRTGNEIQFQNSFPACELKDPPVIEVGEGGTTARFLAGLLLIGKSKYSLILGARLKDRPWQDFIDFAGMYGAKVSLNGNTLSIQGPVNLPREIIVDCSKTTQFATAFQLISVATNSIVHPKNLEASQSYWDMTEELVRNLPKTDFYSIPRDWSSASYPIAFAALNQRIEFPGLFPDQFQADSKLFDLLKEFDSVETTSSGIVVNIIRKHHSVKMNVSDCLDLVPTLVYFLSHVEGAHELTGVENLVHKESDRLTEVVKLARLFERNVSTDGHKLYLEGKKARLEKSIDLVMPDDHRMVMAGSLFLLHHAGGTIGPKGAVSKSYPGFFDLISF